MKNIFTKHPNNVGESYFQHLVKGIGFAIQLLSISFRAFIHAIFPFFFEHSASDKVSDLNNVLQKRRNRSNSDDC